NDNVIRIWEVRTGKELRCCLGHTAEVCTIAFAPDGKTLASSDGFSWPEEDRTIRIWDVMTGKEVRQLPCSRVLSVVYSPDGKTLAVGDNKTIRLLDPASGEERRALRGHKNTIRSMDFSPDGKFLASTGYDNTVRLWEVATGNEVRQ